MTFTNALSRWTTPLILGAFFVSAIPAGTTFGPLAALLVASLGLVLAGSLAFLRTRLTITCDDEGATVTRASPFKGTSTTRFAWGDVDAAEFSDRKVTFNDTERIVRTFTVTVKGERVLEVTSEMRDFDTLTQHILKRIAAARAQA